MACPDVSMDGKSPTIPCSHLAASSIAVCIQGLKIPSLDVNVRSRQILYLEASLLKHEACKPYRPVILKEKRWLEMYNDELGNMQ
jgi:hypothetical protein